MRELSGGMEIVCVLVWVDAIRAHRSKLFTALYTQALCMLLYAKYTSIEKK